ncbi:MAG: hypothetical protein A3F09_00925 [Chlamydiae bacterium RIFCSPHIGHO2_12_FULL_49_11]|nr:MAG: hypothetical protein A3F09_00925 [Chlamydiae bacterium RIFCSPHIGHO2_12_FULL_49_11]
MFAMEALFSDVVASKDFLWREKLDRTAAFAASIANIAVVPLMMGGEVLSLLSTVLSIPYHLAFSKVTVKEECARAGAKALLHIIAIVMIAVAAIAMLVSVIAPYGDVEVRLWGGLPIEMVRAKIKALSWSTLHDIEYDLGH